MPPKPGKKALPARETVEGSSQQAREVGGEGAGESTGSEAEEEVDPAEIKRRREEDKIRRAKDRKREEDREARRQMDERERRLNEREEALRKEQRDHDERVRRSTSRRARRERSGGAGREPRGRSTSRARRSPGRGGRSRSPAKRGRTGSADKRRTRSRTPVRRRSRSRSPAGRRTRTRSPARRRRTRTRSLARRRSYSRSPRRGSRRPRSRESGERRSRSPRRTFDLREKLLRKVEGQSRELAEIKRQMKAMQDSHKDEFNHVKFGVPGGGNQQQMKFVRDIKQTMIHDLNAALAMEFKDKIPPSFSEIVSRGEQLMNFRMKIIAFAEASSQGWRAANEYASLLTNSSDVDLKKQEEADKRAMKKLEKETEKAKRRRNSGIEKAVERTRRPPSRSVKKKKDEKETRECYRCGKVGHISINCYVKDKDKDRRRK